MEKLAFQEITENPDLELFLQRFEDYVGVRLPQDYVDRSKVVGVFLHNRLVGGYMLVLNPGFRSSLFVPDKIKEQNPFFKNSMYDMMEINGLWISSALRNPKLQMAVWFHLVANIFLSKHKFVLLLQNARNRTMGRLLNMAKPTLIYEGAPLLMAGQVTHEKIRVSYATRWSILLNSYKYWLELKSRQRRVKSILSDIPKLSYLKDIRQAHPEMIK